MTIQSAAELYGISKQAIYQRLKSKGIDIRQLKTKAGDLTEEGERILAELFDHSTAASEGEQTKSPSRQEPKKQDDTLLLQAQEEVRRLTALVESLQKDVDQLTKLNQILSEDKERLHRALDQSQQLQAMTMRMLPPAPAERQGVFSWLASRFKRPAQADQEQPKEQDNQ